MTSSRFAPLAFGVGTGLLLTGSAWPVAAQTIGSFQWQLQPYCNVVVVTVSQQAATYTVDGYDDQCAAPQRAPLVGVATPNPDGTIGFGLHVVTVPGGHALDIDARISLPALSGSWTDTAGNSGTFAFGAAAGGSPRPMPPASLPSTVTVLANGAFSSKYNGTGGVITASGGGTRMLWQPVKAAFRAGTVYGDTWDYAMVGYASAAFGISTRAVATGSFAIGNLTSAEGLFSLAAGNLTRSTGEYSAALGWATNATGQASLAVGTGTLASGSGGFAGGQQTTASGPQSVALGLGSTATGEHAFAMGDSSQANAGNAVAFGASARANGYESIAMGQNVTTLGNGGVALGSNATAAAGSWAFGDRSTTNVLSTAVMNQFAARAAGGVTFFTNAAMTAGVPPSSTFSVCSSGEPCSVNATSPETESGKPVRFKLSGVWRNRKDTRRWSGNSSRRNWNGGHRCRSRHLNAFQPRKQASERTR